MPIESRPLILYFTYPPHRPTQSHCSRNSTLPPFCIVRFSLSPKSFQFTYKLFIISIFKKHSVLPIPSSGTTSFSDPFTANSSKVLFVFSVPKLSLPILYRTHFSQVLSLHPSLAKRVKASGSLHILKPAAISQHLSQFITPNFLEHFLFIFLFVYVGRSCFIGKFLPLQIKGNLYCFILLLYP